MSRLKYIRDVNRTYGRMMAKQESLCQSEGVQKMVYLGRCLVAYHRSVTQFKRTTRCPIKGLKPEVI